MPLNNLSLDQLGELGVTIATLHDVGAQLEKAGFGPLSFDLTPGAAIEIRTRALMLDLASVGGVHLTPMAARIVAESFRPVVSVDNPVELPSFLQPQTKSTEAAPSSGGEEAGCNQPEPVEPLPVDKSGPPGGGTNSSAEQTAKPDVIPPPSFRGNATAAQHDAGAAQRSNGAEASGGGQEVAAPKSPAAPTPGSASALAAAAGQWIGQWTDAEDAQLIDAVVQSKIAGTVKAEAIQSVATALGRTLKSVEQRAYRLGARIGAALAGRSAEHQSAAKPEGIILAEPAEDEKPLSNENAAAPEALADLPETAAPAQPPFSRSAPAVPPDGLSGKDLEIWRHLTQPANQPRWPMTIGTDFDLAVGIGRGDKLNVIAADLGIDAKALLARFAVITALVRDDKGRVTIEGLPKVINVLRRLAKAPAEA